MFDFAYSYSTTLKLHRFGRARYTVAYVPKDVASKLPLDKNPRLRVDGEINGYPFSSALHPAGGKWYVLVPKRIQKARLIEIGSEVQIVFDIADQNAVDVPPELARTLAANDRAGRIWDGLTAGKRRGFAFQVASAKRTETRERRIDEVLRQLFQLERTNE